MYWLLGAVVLLVGAWYVGRLRRMHALRGLVHLTDLAKGLRQMQSEVRNSYGRSTSESARAAKEPPPSYTTASGGALLAWTAEPNAGGGALHKITLLSYYETWWANGFLMIYVCDRLGLDLDAIRITRTDRGTTHLFAVLTDTAHAELMAKEIADPPVVAFANYRAGLASQLGRREPPPVLDARELAAS